MSGVGNPIEAHAESPQWQHVWADLHFSSGLSDAYVPVSPGDVFEYARNVSGLDLACLTDHAEGIWSDPLTDEDFSEIVEAARRTNGAGFTALAGFEWTGKFFWDPEYPEGPGNMHVIPLADPVLPCRADSPDCDTPEKLYARLEPAGAIAVWHHSLASWGAADLSSMPMNESVTPLVEIYSANGSSECIGCSPEMEEGTGEAKHSVQAALTRGLKIGFLGSTENKFGHPGMNEFPGYQKLPKDAGGLTCLLVDPANETGYAEALRARHTYATTGIRPLIEFSCDGLPMGSVVRRTEPPTFVISLTFSEPIALIEIVKGFTGAPLPLEAVLTSKPNATSAAFSWTDSDYSGPSFYYLRVTDANGERSWTSPIWTEAPTADIEKPATTEQ